MDDSDSLKSSDVSIDRGPSPDFMNDRDNSFDDSSFGNESNIGGQLMAIGSRKNSEARYVYSKDHHRSRIDMCSSTPPDQLSSRSPSLLSMCNGKRPRDVDSIFKNPNTQLIRDVDNSRSSTQNREDSNLLGTGNYIIRILAVKTFFLFMRRVRSSRVRHLHVDLEVQCSIFNQICSIK